MEHAIEDYFVRNIPMVMVILALIFSGFTIHHHKERVSSTFVIDIFTGYLLFFVVGIADIWAFFMNTFFSTYVIKYFGWVGGPFQIEAAAANLGLGLAGILAIKESFDFRVAVTIIATCLFWGMAAEHVRMMIMQGDFQTGNLIGSTFYVTVIIPVVLIFLLIARGNHSLHTNQ